MELFGHEARDGSRPAVYDAGRETWWTWGELHAAVRQAAAALDRDEKALVFLPCHNDARTLVAYLAALEAGHAVALLDAKTTADQAEALCRRYAPELLLGGDAEAWADCGGRRVGEVPVGEDPLTIRALATDAAAPHPDLAVLLSTSGSTGSPKLVRLSRRNVEANARSIALALGLGPDERAITSLPMHYSYGLSVVNSHLWAGGQLVLTDESIVMRPFWNRFRDLECTSFAGVPYSYELLLRTGFEARELPSLRALTQAGGRLAPHLVERMHRWAAARGVRFFVMYGQTEATARISVLDPDRLPEKLGTVGVPIPDGRVEIVVDGEAVPPGAEGEVVYHGPNVMMGYATERAHLAEGDVLGGRLATGDLGRLDEEGFLRITGRTRRIAKIFGHRLNLDEVEQRVRRHVPAAVADVGGRLVAFCETGDESGFEGWRRELARELRIHHSAIEFRRVPALPLNANGKVDYQRLA